MSGSSAIIPLSPRQRARDALVESLRRLGPEIEKIGRDAESINQEEYVSYKERLSLTLTAIDDLRAAHLPSPRRRVVHALELIFLTLDDAYFPLEEIVPDDRDWAHEFLLNSLGRLQIALRRASVCARAVFEGLPAISGGPTIMDTTQAVIAVSNMVTSLDRFAQAVRAVEREETGIPRFERQDDLIRLFALDMRLEIDVAHAIIRIDARTNSAVLNLPALVNIIAAARDADSDFQASVLGWFDQITDGLKTASRNVSIQVQSLLTGLEALGGMIDTAEPDETGTPPGPHPDTSWADDFGRDRFGFWASFTVTATNGRSATQRLRWIPPGEFMMGSPKDETGRLPNEGPQRRIVIARGFWMFDTPCTEKLWEVVMEPLHRARGPEFPIAEVTWNDTQGFVARLNGMRPGLGIGLPSEAWWEYACRAGSTGATFARPHQVLGDIAWYEANSGGQVHPVAGKAPNDWGLYDMLGNVWEWCADAWGDLDSIPSDGSPRAGGSSAPRRVIRGGSWNGDARNVRTAFRFWNEPGVRIVFRGFRCTRSHVG
jgi:formylglycine-generating enzyme required for sulfatase activity